jgi:NAD(P)-dependent dehydrogenase (short-subunit alcohol dehydrogenase family)
VNRDGLEQTVRGIQVQTPRATVIGETLDSTDLDAAARLIAQVADQWGPFDAVANVAGVIMAKPLIETELADLERLFRINAGGTVVMTRAVLPHLADNGVIVNVSSASAAYVSPGLGAYGASKAANLYLTRAWAAELADRGIRVCGVAPGAVDTAMPRSVVPPGEEGDRLLASSVAQAQLIGRLAQPEEIAIAICYLLSDDASYITGSTLWIDGGTH